ncbi:hypothetical protein GDO78_020625 [Eleutherodactylus coqui]|uniref:Uncharacterized protein n=1 Tax=Eleutherodactylus coqui TaxID=57060 RepID=A0A8J6B9Z4_ELECQ|nr:hypothetical protein GDO78_020625 [Eleutherodactylus coqui]
MEKTRRPDGQQSPWTPAWRSQQIHLAAGDTSSTMSSEQAVRLLEDHPEKSKSPDGQQSPWTPVWKKTLFLRRPLTGLEDFWRRRSEEKTVKKMVQHEEHPAEAFTACWCDWLHSGVRDYMENC